MVLARHGWMRSYLLVSNEQACAFVTGFQFGSRFYLDDMGYDPAWRDYSVGTVLQLLIIEDLFANQQPSVYDLGEYGPHKEEFGNDSYLQGKVLLFRRSAYTTLVRFGHARCIEGTRLASQFLDRWGLKQRMKKMVRMWSSKGEA